MMVRCGSAARPLYPYRLAADDDCCAPAHAHAQQRGPHAHHILNSIVDSNHFGGSCLLYGSGSVCALEEADGGAGSLAHAAPPAPPAPPAQASCPPEVHRTCFCVRFIAEHTRMLEDSTKVKEDWKYIAMVLDRLFLWIFTLAVLVDTAGIILQAPTLYDDRVPIDKAFNQIATSTLVRCPPPV